MTARYTAAATMRFHNRADPCEEGDARGHASGRQPVAVPSAATNDSLSVVPRAHREFLHRIFTSAKKREHEQRKADKQWHVDQLAYAAEEENTHKPGDQDDERGLEEHVASGAAHHPRDDMGWLRAGGRGQDQEKLGGLNGVATAVNRPSLGDSRVKAPLSAGRSVILGEECVCTTTEPLPK